MSLNKVMLIGNIGNMQPGTSNSGVKYVNFSIATNEKVKGVKVTEWHNVTAFNKIAEIIIEYCAVGAKVFLEGKIQSSKYKDKDGVDKTSYKIICNSLQMIEGKFKNDAPPSKESEPFKESDPFDDEIPF